MAKTQIPDPMQRRHVIEKEMDAGSSLAYAEAYVEEGRVGEAIIFFVKAGAEDRLSEISNDAVRDGDAFLLKDIADATGKEPGAEVWLRLSEAASRAGKERYAEMARRHARRRRTRTCADAMRCGGRSPRYSGSCYGRTFPETSGGSDSWSWSGSRSTWRWPARSSPGRTHGTPR